MTAYATRAELRELALMVMRLGIAIDGEQALSFGAGEIARSVVRKAQKMHGRLADAPRPRAVTREEYEAVRKCLVLAWDQTEDDTLRDILAALNLTPPEE